MLCLNLGDQTIEFQHIWNFNVFQLNVQVLEDNTQGSNVILVHCECSILALLCGWKKERKVSTSSHCIRNETQERQLTASLFSLNFLLSLSMNVGEMASSQSSDV